MQNLPLSPEERNGMIQIYSDYHKDAYGFRPRHISVHELSDEQIIEDFQTFGNIVAENNKQEQIQLEYDLKKWDKLIQDTINMGAGDYDTALRWIVQGANDWDAEAIVWSNGILFSDKGRELVQEINEKCNDILREYYEAV